jgi:hypothetical protein
MLAYQQPQIESAIAPGRAQRRLLVRQNSVVVIEIDIAVLIQLLLNK